MLISSGSASDRGLGDMQLSAEFVAHAVHLLALKSTVTNCQISVMTYSQGGANVRQHLSLIFIST